MQGFKSLKTGHVRNSGRVGQREGHRRNERHVIGGGINLPNVPS
jgi:hypothetical protein